MTTRVLSFRALCLGLALLLALAALSIWPMPNSARSDRTPKVVYADTFAVAVPNPRPRYAPAQLAWPQGERFDILRAAVDSGWLLRWVRSVTVHGDTAYVDLEMTPARSGPIVTYIPPWPAAPPPQQSLRVYNRLVVRRNGVWTAARRDSSNVQPEAIESTCIGSGACRHPPQPEPHRP